jgi:ABC-2 type transport system permease protein
MSSTTVAPEASTRPGSLASLVAFYRLLVRTQITVPRLLGIAGLGALAVLIGLFARWDSNPDHAAADAVASYGLGILVPLAALWLGSSALGDLVEDRLLVYLSLKPVPRWQLPAAAVLATATVVVPLTALPLTASALAAGASGVAWPALLAASFGALAYAGLFVAAGLWFRRAIWWGLAFVLIWETVIAYTSEGAARFTVLGWSASILQLAPRSDEELAAGSAAAAFVILPAIAIGAWLATTWRYRSADID